eukprot:6192067-Pleurochrysis_carterae.AAC.1
MCMNWQIASEYRLSGACQSDEGRRASALKSSITVLLYTSRSLHAYALSPCGRSSPYCRLTQIRSRLAHRRDKAHEVHVTRRKGPPSVENGYGENAGNTTSNGDHHCEKAGKKVRTRLARLRGKAASRACVRGAA